MGEDASYAIEGTVLTVGDKDFELYKRGGDYAQQFGRLTSWLGTHAVSALMDANDQGVLTDSGSGIEMIAYMLGDLDADALIDLSALLIGSDYKFAEKHFDPGWTIEALLIVLQRDGIRRAFTRIWESFFLGTQSESVDAEAEASD